MLCVPQIPIAFVYLCTLLLPLFDCGETLSFLIPLPRRLRALATDKDRPANDQANKLKLFHMLKNKMDWTIL